MRFLFNFDTIPHHPKITMVHTRSMLHRIQSITSSGDSGDGSSIIGYKLVFVEPKSIIKGGGNETQTIFGIAKLEISLKTDSNLGRAVENNKYAKYRAASARVLKIKSILGTTMYGRGYSALKPGGHYSVGKEIHADQWNSAEINNVCTNGIHFYLSKNAVYSLYKKLTFQEKLPFFNDERIDKVSQPNSRYVSCDDDGKIDFKLYYDQKGLLYKIRYPQKAKTHYFRNNYD